MLGWGVEGGGEAEAVFIKKLSNCGCALLTTSVLLGGEGAWHRAVAVHHLGS